MTPEGKLGYRTQFRRRKRRLFASLLSYSKSFGFRLKRALFSLHPQHITGRALLIHLKKEASD